MKTTFEEIIDIVLDHEGGYVNDPDDAGGETKYGIAKRWYPDVDIKNLTKEQAKKIYHTDYWRRGKCDELPPQLRHIYFDMCVNFGRRGAVKVLQQAANSKSRNKIEVDGGINFSNSKLVKEAGANILVSGTTIFKDNEGDIKKNIETTLRVFLL